MKIECYFLLIFLIVSLVGESLQGKKGEDDNGENPHRDASMCEVCKFLTEEFKQRLFETGKTKEVLETGHGLDTKKKRKEYKKSELRFIEALTDPHVCDKILEYNIHAERKGSLRFAKGRSQTMQTLRNLQNKGVKVELGIPDELWESPSASVTEMQRKCFRIVEMHEEDLEGWYFGSQEEDLTQYLCEQRVLAKDDKDCLREIWDGKGKDKATEQTTKTKLDKKLKDSPNQKSNSQKLGENDEDDSEKSGRDEL